MIAWLLCWTKSWGASIEQRLQHRRCFIDGIHQTADDCQVGGIMIASVAFSCLCMHLLPPLKGTLHVDSSFTVVRSKLEVNCQPWRESTFNLEQAIRGGLFLVNTTDGKDKADSPRSMQGEVKGQPHYMVCSACSFCRLLLGSGGTHCSEAGVTFFISKSNQHWGLHKIRIALQVLLNVFPSLMFFLSLI